jgi:hypothetical protein
MPQSVDLAFDLFTRVACSAGHQVIAESHPEAFGSRLLSVRRNGAELRLVWDGKDGYLSVQISHGPSSGERAGWIDLYGETCSNGLLPDSPAPEREFLGSVEHGLDLMDPRRKNVT